jgi:competence protein ComEC
VASEAVQNQLLETLAEQRQQGLLWIPVWMGVGIWGFFELTNEPSVLVFWACVFLTIIMLGYGVLSRHIVGIFSAIVGLVLLGFVVSVIRVDTVSGPVLGWRYYGPVTGTVVAIDRSGSDKPRLTLKDPTMGKISAPRTPKYIRVSLHSDQTELPKPGALVSIVGSFSPPNGPSEPRGYDFQRRAWFQRLGAVGYSRKHFTVLAEASENSWRLRVFRARLALSAELRKYLPVKEGGFAAAIIAGDRAFVDRASLQHLRRANLAHLLAISGLHMGLMTGVVFALIRVGLALFPRLALRLPAKKIAAVCAIFVGLSYLVLSGASVATQRAFVMVAMMLGAILIDRPAISLRAVAMAAIIILTIWPENLLEPGFQMSFSATIALVVVFRGLKNVRWWQAMYRGRWRYIQPIVGLMGSSLVAGAATAPFAAYHFNQMAHYGLIANVISLPLMSLIVMPCAVLAAVMWPIGLHGIALWGMGQGIAAILAVAAWVSGLGGAVSQVTQAPPFSLMILVGGAVVIILLRDRMRWLGLPAVFVAGLMWTQGNRPDVLVTGNGRLVGVLDSDERTLNRRRGNGFAARSWVENDGLLFDQVKAASLFAHADDDRFMQKIGDAQLFYLWGKKLDVDELDDLCREYDVLIAPQWGERVDGNCEFWGKKRLRYDGSLSFEAGKEGLKIETARQNSGRRMWSSYYLRKERGVYSAD